MDLLCVVPETKSGNKNKISKHLRWILMLVCYKYKISQSFDKRKSKMFSTKYEIEKLYFFHIWIC